MKTIIAGSRSITDYAVVADACERCGWEVTEVVCGCARGVDRLGERWAKSKHIPVRYFPADWDTYGKSAGYRRNAQMASYADALIAVWDGRSKGTCQMIRLAYESNLTMRIVSVGPAAVDSNASGE